MNMQTKMVVFDIAGTTIEDSDDVHKSLINAMGAKGYKITREDANRVMGYPKPLAIETLLQENFKISAERERKALVEKIYNHFLLDMLHHYRYNPDVRAKPNVEYVFDTLRKRGIKVVLDTGFAKEITDAIVERMQWGNGRMIDLAISSDEVKHGRPYPDMIQKAMEEFDIKNPNEVAKVGDTPADLREGMNAKCGYVIGLTWGAYKREELEMEKYTHLADDIVEVLRILK